MTERKWTAIAPRAFTVVGGQYGEITLDSTVGFKVKQNVQIKGAALLTLQLEIKEVIDLNTLLVGPKGKITARTDLSSYPIGSTIEAPRQDRSEIPQKEYERAVYAEEPIMAKRAILVDNLGDYFHTGNPLPVRLSDGSVNIGTVNAEVEVQLSRVDNNPDIGDIHDSVRVGNQTLEWDFFSLGGGLGAGRTYNENPLTDPVQTQLGNGTSVISTTSIGPDTILNVKKAEDPTFYTRISQPDANTRYIGKTYDLDAATSSAVWQIQREVISGSNTITQFASDSAAYTFIWDDRTTYFGAAPFVNGKSLQFDGANDFVDVADNILLRRDFRTQAYSWNMWIKTPNTSASKTYLGKMPGNVGWRFYLTGQDLTLELRGTGGSGDRIRVRTSPGDAVGNTLNNGSWHMISATYDGSGLASGVKLYIDGVASTLDIQNDALTTNSSSVGNMSIAANSGGGNNFGPGNIDEVSTWDVELSAANITSLYNSGTPTDLQGFGVSPITTSLVYWARMGDGPSDSYPSIIDVESGIIGTMTGMTPGDIESETP